MNTKIVQCDNGRWAGISKLYSVSIVMILMISSLGLMILLPDDISPFDSVLAEDTEPNGYVCITFDDGTQDQYLYAYPMLRDAGFTATFFVPSTVVNTPGYMTSSELIEMESNGFEIGGHTLGDNPLYMSIDDANQSLKHSHDDLEAIGLNISTFAWASGLWNDTLVDMATSYYERTRSTDPYFQHLLQYPDYIKCVGSTSISSKLYAREVIDYAAATHGVSIINIHVVNSNGYLMLGDTITDMSIQYLISYIQEKGLETISFNNLPNPSSNRPKFVWDGEGSDELASNVDNWYKINIDGSVINNESFTPYSDFVINTTSKNCNWDISTSDVVYSLSVRDNYTGILTQLSDIRLGINGLYFNRGVFTASNSYNIYCLGSFIKNTESNPTWTSNLGNIILEGNDTFLMLNGNAIKSLHILGNNVILDRTLSISGSGSFYVDINKELVINDYAILAIRYYSTFGNCYVNGTITGNGILRFDIYDTSKSLPLLDNVITNIYITLLSGSPSYTVTLTSDINAILFYMYNQGSSSVLTIDINDHNIITDAITIGNLAAVTGGNGNITVNTWDSSIGNWNPETSNVHFINVGTVKTGSEQTFYDITLDSTSNITQLSNIEVTNWLEPDSGIWNRNGYVLTSPMFTSSTEPDESMNENEFYEYYFMTNVTIDMSVNDNEASFLTISENEYGDPGISGMIGPGDSGIYNIELEFTNTILGTIYVNYTLTVNNTIFCYITSAPETNWTTGTMYYYNVMVVGNGTITYNIDTNGPFIVSNLSGVISGMPDVGYYDIIFWATDDDGNIAYQNWTLTVSPVVSEWSNDEIVDIVMLVIIMGFITLFNYLGYVKNSFLLQILSFIVFIFVLVPLWPGSEIGGLLVLVFGIGNIGLLIGGLMK